MATSYPFQVLTPAAQLAAGEATYAQVPGVGGSFGVLSGHAPLVSLLADNAPLVLTLANGTTQSFTITGGVAEVTPEGLTILAESAVQA